MKKLLLLFGLLFSLGSSVFAATTTIDNYTPDELKSMLIKSISNNNDLKLTILRNINSVDVILKSKFYQPIYKKNTIN